MVGLSGSVRARSLRAVDACAGRRMPAASRRFFMLLTIGWVAPSWCQAKKGRSEKGVVDVERPV
jgi:hypothetical protein